MFVAGCAACLAICGILFAIYHYACVRDKRRVTAKCRHLEEMYNEMQDKLAEQLQKQQDQLEVGGGSGEGTEDEDNGY